MFYLIITKFIKDIILNIVFSIYNCDKIKLTYIFFSPIIDRTNKTTRERKQYI